MSVNNYTLQGAFGAIAASLLLIGAVICIVLYLVLISDRIWRNLNEENELTGRQFSDTKLREDDNDESSPEEEGN